ncbi:FHA domain-containing protein [Streptomyces avermitilis]|uniref:FHA domain-containing protein n=1 Tax=Streptomyces avermitilis TaxID=33903 RepID=UPI0033A8AAD1
MSQAVTLQGDRTGRPGTPTRSTAAPGPPDAARRFRHQRAVQEAPPLWAKRPATTRSGLPFDAHHARSKRRQPLTPRGYVLHDRESSNGTLVNGEEVEPQLLQSGDEITMG